MSEPNGAHRARKRFGQNFLNDRQIIARIVAAIAPAPDDLMVEIGPGQAALTAPLLQRLNRLKVIEIDRDLVARLQQRPPPGGQLEIIQADALNVNFAELAPPGQLRVVGNLPYNISTPILFHLLDALPTIRDMHFMLQREVVERMAAASGSKVYGRLSVMLQVRCRVQPLFLVPAAAFTPAPKVESAIVRLQPLGTQPDSATLTQLERLTKAGFGQRRKTLSNALRGLVSPEQLLEAGIEAQLRAEAVAVESWLKLAAMMADTVAGDGGEMTLT